MIRRPPRSTLTYALVLYTTLFRSPRPARLLLLLQRSERRLRRCRWLRRSRSTLSHQVYPSCLTPSKHARSIRPGRLSRLGGLAAVYRQCLSSDEGCAVGAEVDDGVRLFFRLRDTPRRIRRRGGLDV